MLEVLDGANKCIQHTCRSPIFITLLQEKDITFQKMLLVVNSSNVKFKLKKRRRKKKKLPWET